MTTDGPINLHTFGDLQRYGYRLTIHCPTCRDYRDLDLTKIRPDRPHIGARFKCGACGGPGSATLSQISTGNSAHLPALERWRGTGR
ncbi:hypothetical protein [Hoeflea sp.]|uniref:hypothetical protein n=1 Tax=Hoeflea sp. TaxID=1940281 RepID=UPI003B51FC7E